MKTISIKVTGKVQGVFFRESTKEQATALGVAGTVCNLPDGGVEIICTGTPEQLESLINWCRQGPPKAKVTDVQWKENGLQSFNGFTVIR